MQIAPKPKNENERLNALRSYRILDSQPEQQYDDICKLASLVCGAPISVISLVDESRQWFKAKVGLDAPETSRDVAFCAHAILDQKKPFIVPDATKDPRFSDNPLVTGGPQIQFYAGTALVTSDGYPLGTLCVIDKKPRQLSAHQIEALESLGRQVILQLELRRAHTVERQRTDELEQHHLRYRMMAERIQATLNACLDGVVTTDYDGKILDWNPQAERMTGWSHQEVVGRSIFEILFAKTTGDHFRKLLARYYNHGETGIFNRRIEMVALRRNGEKFPIEIATIPIPSQGGILFSGFFRDLSELKQHQKILEDHRAQLVASSKMSSLGEMASGIAHEINNPLAIIRGHIQLLARAARNQDLDPEQILETTAKVEDTVVRIAKIISGLRAFARDGNSSQFEPLHVNRLFDDTLALCQAKFTQKDVKLHVDIENPETVLTCQPVQLSQVLLNLLNNAFDAVSGQTEKWIRIKAYQEGEQLVILISDSGPGVPEKIRDQIMLPFFTTKPVGKGTGLGLSISKGIVEQHDGQFSLDKESPTTQFRIVLPLSGPSNNRKTA
ncbi:MAG: ATP-binding protein [Bdellovibrionales bacterium]